MSLVNVSFLDSDSQPFDPEAFFNIEKGVDIARGWYMVLGTQTGTRVLQHGRGPGLENFSYIDHRVQAGGSAAAFHAGGYFANRLLSGTCDVLGYFGGVQVPLPNSSWILSHCH